MGLTEGPRVGLITRTLIHGTLEMIVQGSER